MIEIRTLTDKEMEQAIALKIMCWTEELDGKAENTLIYSKELDFWINWVHSAEENNDVRLCIGAFENEKLLGAAFASYADDIDIPEHGIELNGLWVFAEERKRGISLRLLSYVIDFYQEKGKKEMAIYNIHTSDANRFYLKFGAKVKTQMQQLNGAILVDVFVVNLETFKTNIQRSLQKYL